MGQRRCTTKYNTERKTECEKWLAAIHLMIICVFSIPDVTCRVWALCHWISAFEECWLEAQSLRGQMPTQLCQLPFLGSSHWCRFLCHPAITSLVGTWPTRTGAVRCVFFAKSLMVCHTAWPECQPVHPTCLPGCRIRLLCTCLASGPCKSSLAFYC